MDRCVLLSRGSDRCDSRGRLGDVRRWRPYGTALRIGYRSLAAGSVGSDQQITVLGGAVRCGGAGRGDVALEGCSDVDDWHRQRLGERWWKIR